jgi:hypothetical protein
MNLFGITRRRFLELASLGAGLSGAAVHAYADESQLQKPIQPIRGSWFEFQHCWTHESGYWDAACAAFTCEQWKMKIREIAEIGLQYLVLLSVAQDGKVFYTSKYFPSWKLGCGDPLEAVLSEADAVGIKIFISGGFFDEKIGALADAEGVKKRFQAMAELVERYGTHASFYGWYWPNEAALTPYFDESFIRYCNQTSEEARKLKPNAKILIAPYGTRSTKDDAAYARQLEHLNVDIIAYQDEVGVRKTRVDELGAIFARLRSVHDRVPKVALWADMEIFDFEGQTYKSNLIPASFERVRGQLTAISPHVDTVLVYQYQGMMNEPGSPVFAGHPDSVKLYADYREWVKIMKLNT